MTNDTDSDTGRYGNTLALLREMKSREAREVEPGNRKADRRMLAGVCMAAVGFMLSWLGFNMGWGAAAENWLVGIGAVICLSSAYPIVTGFLGRR